MPARSPGPWPRKGRGYYVTIRGRQHPLGKDKKEAYRRYHLLLSQAVPSAPGTHTIPQLVDIFFDDCENRVKKEKLSPETFKSYRECLTPWSQTHRSVKPDDLRVYHLSRWLGSHSQWNDSTRTKATSIVRIWSRWVARQGYAEVDRLGLAQSPGASTREPADPAHLIALEAAIGDPDFRDWYQVLYDTGCRPGELRRLEASHVDLNDCAAIVRGKVGLRVIGLSERAASILRARALRYPDGPLLRTSKGRAWSGAAIKWSWDKWRSRAKLPDTLIPYSCRHDLPRRWRAAGIGELTVARQMGHTLRGVPHLSLLVSTYGHVSAPELAQAAARVQTVSAPRQPADSARRTAASRRRGR